MEKPEFENFTSILDNFDAFCDEFESRAAKAFMRGDSDNGKFNRAVTESGGDAPEVIQEIGGSGNAPIEIGETFVDVSSSSVE